MKTIIAFLFLFTVNFSQSQSALIQQQNQNITGSWVNENDANNKWIFTSSTICKWEFNGATINQFIYLITSEFSANGVEHPYLKLVNVSNPNETYEYAINSLENDKMTLETFEPKLGYIYFTKQQAVQ